MRLVLLILCGLILECFSNRAEAFPTGTIWIPSDLTEDQNVWRADNQIYFTPHKRASDAVPPAPSLDEGITFCFKKSEFVAMEAGGDWVEPVREDAQAPHLHAKIVLPERGDFPSLVGGIYDLGFSDITNYNVAYVGVGKTFPQKARVFAGIFYGNGASLVDENGAPSNKGLMFSVIYPLEFLWDKLTFILDFQSSRSALGAFNIGGDIALLPSFDLIVGFNMYNNPRLQRDTVTVQFNVRF